MSGGSSKSGSAQRWARPIAQNAANTATGVFNNAQGNTQMLSGAVSGLVPGLVEKYNAGNPAVGAATGYAADVLAGKYLDGNPQLDAIIGKVRSGVSDSVNSNFAGAGRYGSGAHTGVLADSLAEAESGLRYNDYNAQQGRMDQMAALSPQLAQAGYTGLAELLQAAGIGAELPFAGLDSYTGSLGTLFSGGKQKQGTMGSVLGGLGSLASSAASLKQAGMF